MKSFAKKGTVHLEDMPGMMVELLEQIKVLGDKIDSMQNANASIQSQKTELTASTTSPPERKLALSIIFLPCPACASSAGT